MNKITITITGHRLLSTVQQQRIAPVLKQALQNIIFTERERDPDVSFLAISPLAEGADTLFAEAALELDLPLQVLLPFEQEIYLTDFSSDDVKARFGRLYNTETIVDRKVLNSAKNRERNDLYYELGQKIVDDTDYLVAIWNEKPARGKGGTADVLNYALLQKKNILLINSEREYPAINYLHADSGTTNHEKDALDSSDTNHLMEFINERQNEYDTNASKYNKKYKKVWAVCFVLGLIEVFAFSLIISFHVSLGVHFLLALTEFLCILSIILLLLFGGSKELHSKYVHCRIIGERLRIKRYFAELGFHIYSIVVSPIYAAFKEKPEYNILDNTTRLINLSAWSYLSFDTKKQRIHDELIIDQYKYHERKKEKFEKKNALYKRVRSLLFLLLLSAVVLHFLHVANEYLLEEGVHLTSWEFPLFHFKIFEEIVLFLSIFVPATIAASEALKYLYEWEKIITLSGSMANYFKQEAKKLQHTHTNEDLEVFLNSINKDMLIENLDWEKYMHDKNEVPT